MIRLMRAEGSIKQELLGEVWSELLCGRCRIRWRTLRALCTTFIL